MNFKRQNIKLITSILLLINLISCKDKLPYLKINSPANGEVFTAPEVITVSVQMSDPDVLYGKDLLVTKENTTHDTVINFADHGNNVERDVIKSFTSEAGTTYKIWAKVTGVNMIKTDSVFVTAN